MFETKTSLLYTTSVHITWSVMIRRYSQARAAGHRIKRIIGDDSVHLFVSPFERTLQTARNLRVAIEPNVAGLSGRGNAVLHRHRLEQRSTQN